MVDTQAAPGCRWWSGRKSDQGLAGCVSGPVHNQDHTMKHTGQLPAHQVRALPRRFCPGFGRIGGKRLRCKPILGALLSWVVQEKTAWPPKPPASLDVVARRPGFGVVHHNKRDHRGQGMGIPGPDGGTWSTKPTNLASRPLCGS